VLDHDWWAEHDVELVVGDAATGLDLTSAAVTLASGREIGYDKLLLATGAAPRPLDVPGAELDGVLVLRRADDAERVAAALERGGRMVVVGGGWIGLEVAAAARGKGLDVVVVEPQRAPLERALGSEVGLLWAQLHRRHGVDVRLGIGVRALHGNGSVSEVELDDGTRVPADVVLVGVGAVPNLDLAEQAGLAVDGAVPVDQRLRTRDERVWAAGDIAFADNGWWGAPLRVEHWANAQDQGALAGALMAGGAGAWAQPPYFYTDQYDAGMEYHGYADASSARVVLRGDTASGEYVAFWLDGDGAVTAAMHVNRWDDSDPLKALVTAKAVVAPERLSDTDVPVADLAG
jgi:3-phenylpropionate/trans-cinnamate dioxygenase ferredoxin reductase subunit